MHGLVSSCSKWGLRFSYGARASHYSSFSCWGTQALGHAGFNSWGTQAQLPCTIVESYLLGPGTEPLSSVLANGFFNHWTIREVLQLLFFTFSSATFPGPQRFSSWAQPPEERVGGIPSLFSSFCLFLQLLTKNFLVCNSSWNASTNKYGSCILGAHCLLENTDPVDKFP